MEPLTRIQFPSCHSWAVFISVPLVNELVPHIINYYNLSSVLPIDPHLTWKKWNTQWVIFVKCQPQSELLFSFSFSGCFGAAKMVRPRKKVVIIKTTRGQKHTLRSKFLAGMLEKQSLCRAPRQGLPSIFLIARTKAILKVETTRLKEADSPGPDSCGNKQFIDARPSVSPWQTDHFSIRGNKGASPQPRCQLTGISASRATFQQSHWSWHKLLRLSHWRAFTGFQGALGPLCEAWNLAVMKYNGPSRTNLRNTSLSLVGCISLGRVCASPLVKLATFAMALE